MGEGPRTGRWEIQTLPRRFTVQGDPGSGSGWAPPAKAQAAATGGPVTGGLQWAWAPNYSVGLFWGVLWVSVYPGGSVL